MTETTPDDPRAQRQRVRERYAQVAAAGSSCCDDTDDTDSTDDTDDTDGGCCTPASETASADLGYSAADLAAVAEGADLGLGCGNPGAIAELSAGDVVLDLGSGAGFDCFLAAREVGPDGRVIGVDMTPEMVDRARENVRKNDVRNVEFRLGEIEQLPVADGRVDVIISNCVINLSPEKPRVFEEAFRVLRPGGRFAVSDVVLTAALPDDVLSDPASLAACISGASPVEELERLLATSGFVDVRIEPIADSAAFISEWDDDHDLSAYVRSASIEARKPADADDDC